MKPRDLFAVVVSRYVNYNMNLPNLYLKCPCPWFLNTRTLEKGKWFYFLPLGLWNVVPNVPRIPSLSPVYVNFLQIEPSYLFILFC